MSVIVRILQTLLGLCCGPSSASSQTEPEQHHPAPHRQPQEQSYPAPHQKPQGQPQEQYPPTRPPRQQHHRDDNQINQHDERYVSLRAQARSEGDRMAEAFRLSHEAYSNGDGARAKELSDQGKEHQRKMESLNKKASDWIFIENNKDSQASEIDLHGLFVKEAIEHTDRAIQEAKQRGDPEIHLIVGKGMHSPGGIAKIKPAIEELMQKHKLLAELDPNNEGVLIVHINGGDGGQGVDPDEIARRLQKQGEGCIVM